jgi:flagellar hook-associated protein 1 FlgK
LLQPVAQATSSMQRVLADPRGIAAASPFTAQIGAANTGTASVDALRVASSSFNPNLNANISFTSNNGNYNWELRNASTNALVSSGTGTWTAGQPIVLNGWELDLDGVPLTADTLTVNKTTFPASNNGNAIALLGLRDETLVGRELVSGVPALGETVTSAYASAMADIGVRVQSARFAADFSHTVALEAEAARTSRAGVNLDEEAARLIQFQQSYQAAAKVLTVAQSIFDTLLEVTSPR